MSGGIDKNKGGKQPSKRDSKVQFNSTVTSNYGSISGLAESNVEGDRTSEEVLLNPPGSDMSRTGSVISSSYDSEAYDTFDENDSDDDDDDDDDMNPEKSITFHLGQKQVSASNVWTSVRRTSSFHDHGNEYELVPSQLEDNIKLVQDPNLFHKREGRLYYAEKSFYNNAEMSKYALTVQSDIFRKIFNEVDDAMSIPCGLYFCCHGGDGAHTGVSHDDYVDIRLAWFVVTIIFFMMITVSVAIPWPASDFEGTDDFFSGN